MFDVVALVAGTMNLHKRIRPFYAFIPVALLKINRNELSIIQDRASISEDKRS